MELNDKNKEEHEKSEHKNHLFVSEKATILSQTVKLPKLSQLRLNPVLTSFHLIVQIKTDSG